MFSKDIARYTVWCVLPLFVLWLGCSEGNTVDADAIEVEDVQLVDTAEDGPVLQGEFINRTDDPIRVAQVRVTIFDGDNQPLGDALVEVRDIEPNSRKTFRSVVEIEGDVQRAKVQGVLIP